jgi:hypothetical protein
VIKGWAQQGAMQFAPLKIHHRFERMRLRGLSGARDEIHLAAIAQNPKTLASRIVMPLYRRPWVKRKRPEGNCDAGGGP